MNSSDQELKIAVKKALAILIANLPYPKDPSPGLTEGWCIVLASEGVEAYQVELAMVDALKLEAFPPPIVFAKLCREHKRLPVFTGADCLPINTTAPALEPRSTEKIREQMARLKKERAMPNPELVDPEQEARVKAQIAARKQTS